MFSAATIYQNDTTIDTCSGATHAAYISRCYNTSWAYYSIDQCAPVTSGPSSSTPPTPVTTSDTTSALNAVSGGAIAGAVVGSVCGLGIIAAVCVYLFWFRPKQKKENDKKERHGPENRTAAETESMSREGKSMAGTELHGLRQQPPEPQSVESAKGLPVEGVFEAPGDGGGVEVDNDAQLPAELPVEQGTAVPRGNSSVRSYEAQIYQR